MCKFFALLRRAAVVGVDGGIPGPGQSGTHWHTQHPCEPLRGSQSEQFVHRCY
jgi:hypothetical protein